MQPAAQLAPAHRRCRSIEPAPTRTVRPIRETRRELQVATRRCVEQHSFAAFFGAQAAQMRQGGLLRIAYILQEAACGGDSQQAICTTESRQVARLELIAERARR